MEPRELAVQRVKHYFRSNYEELILCDVRAVYLWGSILRPDFDALVSDVDCVAVCGSQTAETSLRKFRDDVRRRYEELTLLNIRSLHISDLNGFPPRGDLARVIAPRLLVSDFAHWIWVCGDHLSGSDFAIRPCSLKEAYRIRLQTLIRRMHKCSSLPRTEAPVYVLKEAAYLSHVIHQISEGEHPFTYSDLESRSTSVTAPLARTISALRFRGWPVIECEQALPLVLELLNQITQKSWQTARQIAEARL